MDGQRWELVYRCFTYEIWEYYPLGKDCGPRMVVKKVPDPIVPFALWRRKFMWEWYIEGCGFSYLLSATGMWNTRHDAIADCIRGWHYYVKDCPRWEKAEREAQ